MYKKFYGFKEEPFDSPRNPSLLCLTDSRLDLLKTMEGVMGNDHCLNLLSGVSGVGKTSLAEHLLNRLNSSFVWANVNASNTAFEEPLTVVSEVFDLFSEQCFQGSAENRFQSFLNRTYLMESKRALLFIDNAHELSLEVLIRIEDLLNNVLEKRFLFQILLCGRPELLDNSHASGIRKNTCQSPAVYSLEPLSPEESIQYIKYRLAAVQTNRIEIFDQHALAAIVQYSGGIPGTINTLCHTILQYGALDNQETITKELAAEAVKDMQLNHAIGNGSDAPLKVEPIQQNVNDHDLNKWDFLNAYMNDDCPTQLNTARAIVDSNKSLDDQDEEPCTELYKIQPQLHHRWRSGVYGMKISKTVSMVMLALLISYGLIVSVLDRSLIKQQDTVSLLTQPTANWIIDKAGFQTVNLPAANGFERKPQLHNGSEAVLRSERGLQSTNNSDGGLEHAVFSTLSQPNPDASVEVSNISNNTTRQNNASNNNSLPVAEESAIKQPNREIQGMLKKAKRQFDQNNLISPVGDSALDIFLDVLLSDPDHSEALQGIENIKLRYIALAKVAKSENNFDKARDEYQKAILVSRINLLRLQALRRFREEQVTFYSKLKQQHFPTSVTSPKSKKEDTSSIHMSGLNN